MTIVNTIAYKWDLVLYIILFSILGAAITGIITSLIDIVLDNTIGSVSIGRLKIIAPIIVFIGAIIGGTIGYSIYPGPKTRYEVILDDTYPVNKLFEEYEVIDKRGDIYTVEPLDGVNTK